MELNSAKHLREGSSEVLRHGDAIWVMRSGTTIYLVISVAHLRLDTCTNADLMEIFIYCKEIVFRSKIK